MRECSISLSDVREMQVKMNYSFVVATQKKKKERKKGNLTLVKVWETVSNTILRSIKW